MGTNDSPTWKAYAFVVVLVMVVVSGVWVRFV